MTRSLVPTRFISIFLGSVLGVLMPGLESSVRSAETNDSRSRIELRKKKYGMATEELQRLVEDIEKLSPMYEKRAQDKSKLFTAETAKENLRSLHVLKNTAEQINAGSLDLEAGEGILREVAWAFKHNEVNAPVFVRRIEVLVDLFRMNRLLKRPVGKGVLSQPAINLAQPTAQDLSLVDPKDSTMWIRPGSIENQDLYAGFGRSALPTLDGQVCEYDEPKVGYTGHAGFHVICGEKTKVNVKFGEVSTGPFGARVAWALGFHAEPADYAPEVRVKYTRKLFEEFNLRQTSKIRIGLIRPLEFEVGAKKIFDPFDFIEKAVLRDGREISGKLLRSSLNPDGGGIDEEFERRIDHLVMSEASVRIKEDSKFKTLGYWDWNDREHVDQREFRASALLHAWINSWDVAYRQNKLKAAQTPDGNWKLIHMVSDYGQILGRADGVLQSGEDLPNEFPWEFTEPATDPARVRIKRYMPAMQNESFKRMNLDDARWMARLIGSLTRRQIVEALIGSGFDSARVALFTEKLVSRRDQMVQDLGLERELGLLSPAGTNRALDHDPVRDGPVRIQLTTGELVSAREGGDIVEKGRLKRRRP